jgi:hypothetical protein
MDANICECPFLSFSTLFNLPFPKVRSLNGGLFFLGHECSRMGNECSRMRREIFIITYMEENGWKYLELFNMGVLEATGKMDLLKHVLVRMAPEAAKNTLHCFIDGTLEPEVMKDIPLKREFMVRIKCADKETGLFLTAKGKACVHEVGYKKQGLYVRLDVKVTAIAAYTKQTDEKGIDTLEPLYNELTEREHKKAKLIEHY